MNNTKSAGDSDLFKEVWASLDDRMRNVLEWRLVGFTLEQIGQELGLTRERIRQIESEGLLSLRLHVSTVFPLFAEQLATISDESCAVPVPLIEELLATDCSDGVAVLMQAQGFKVCRAWDFKVPGWWVKDQKLLSFKLDNVISGAPFQEVELAERVSAAGLPVDFPIHTAIASSRSGLDRDRNGNYIRRRSRNSDAAYLWLAERAEAAEAEEIASGIGVESVRALTESMRRDKDRFVQIRPEGTWAVRDWGYVDGTTYGNATEAVLAVLTEMGPLTWQQVVSETMRRYPVTAWRINQCQFSREIGITDDGRYDLFERGARHIVPREPSIPDYMAEAGKTVAVRLPVNAEMLRGSGLGAHVWLAWKLGLYYYPAERIFSINLDGEPARLTVRRSSSGTGISSLRSMVVAMGLRVGCCIVAVFGLEESTVKLHHACGSSCPNSVG